MNAKRTIEEVRIAREQERLERLGYMGAYRKRKDVRLKLRARRAVFVAVRAGRLKPLPCELCGATKTEAHHPDYSKPLAVRWLCKRHHESEHSRLHYLTKP